jgi:hypothetical protein
LQRAINHTRLTKPIDIPNGPRYVSGMGTNPPTFSSPRNPAPNTSKETIVTATKEITIADKPFTVIQPYVAGHVVTEAEAKALNQTRAENIRNNMASKVKAAYAGTAKEGEPTAATIVAFVADYDAAYVFTLASVGGGARKTDPIEVEALKIARAMFADFCAGKNLTVKAVRDKIGEEAYQAKLALLAEQDGVVKEATRRVKERAKTAASALADMDLGDLVPAGEPEPEPAH